MCQIQPGMRALIIRFALTGLIVMSGAFSYLPPAYAHPEDEFCTPGEDGMDPALCRELARLNSSEDIAEEAPTQEETAAINVQRSVFATVLIYIRIGFQHILPGGLDHILFVIALFLASTKLKPLLIQISAFTLAHTATLMLTALGLITPASGIIEPLIALTIAWAAIENLIFKTMRWWRPLLVFAFGLVHGMGFAGAFGDLGLPKDLFWTSLIGFNLGVEIGQLAIIGMAFAAAVYYRGVLHQAGRMDLYRPLIVWPLSALIAAAGLWWACVRAGLF